jgi:glycosyltransferase involved in cell wall biosynthesis
MILLIGNYSLDRQQSMQRFATMMLDGLAAAGVPAQLVQPPPSLGKIRWAGRFVAKWLAYIDKFILFRPRLRKKIAALRPHIVHIPDHSNAMYAGWIREVPVVVTCHDLLAVRGALDESTDCPATFTGKRLQRWIVAGLEKATLIVCDSQATLADAQRLVTRRDGTPRLEAVTLGLSYPYRKLPDEEARKRLAAAKVIDPSTPFVLHVGSNLRRKNREGVLRIFARCKDQWNGALIFVGEPLTESLRSLGRELGVADRIVELPEASNELLEALYNLAIALLFPSSCEGFGWPIAEAHACGCPVTCTDREPMTEVGGAAALVHPIEDEAGFAADLLRLANPEERARWSTKALDNAQRFSTERMISQYIALYRSLGTAA